MNVQVNPEVLRHISEELYEISSDLAKLSPELESISRELQKQTVFHPSIKILDKAAEALGGERYQFTVLAQALSNIARMYSEADERTGDLFSAIRFIHNYAEPIYFSNFTTIQDRLFTLLYGGESQWQK